MIAPLLLSLPLLLSSSALPTGDDGGPRVAVIVGANAAPDGRRPLRFAQADATRMASTLTDVGGFSEGDVTLLLDPDPAVLLSALESAAARAGDGMLLFYYSGHGDGDALFPAGRPVALSEVSRRLPRGGPGVRLGIVDTCRGGAWTRAKGLSPVAPFAVTSDLRAQGLVLMASSAGTEDAFEAAALEGSVFTHHMVAGLRGAADLDGDGQVTANEVFRHARAGTVRDTLLITGAAQHPSFEMDLRGHDQLVLARPGAAPTRMEVVQEEGPLQVVRAEDGRLVAQLPPGRRKAALALPPGRYLVIEEGTRGRRTHEVVLAPGEEVRVVESDLKLAAHAAPVPKGLPMSPATLPDEAAELRVTFGRTNYAEGIRPWNPHTALTLDLRYAMSDRWELLVTGPAVARRFGSPERWEGVLWAGNSGWSLGRAIAWGWEQPEWEVAALQFHLGAGFDQRLRVGRNTSLNLGADLFAPAGVIPLEAGNTLQDDGASPYGQLTFGITHRRGTDVTFHAGAALMVGPALPGVSEGGSWPRHRRPSPAIEIGGVQRLGLRRLPLMEVHLGAQWSLELDARVNFVPGIFGESFAGRATVGFSHVF